MSINYGTFVLAGGGLRAGSISIGNGGALLIANSQQYTGTNALGEPITDNGAVTIQNSSSATLTGNISGSGAVTIQNSSSANFAGSISGSETILIQNSSAGTFGSFIGSEAFKIQNSAKAIVSGAVSGSESFTINASSQLILAGAVNTTGSFSLANSSTLEFASSDNANVAFGQGGSTLKLDHSLTAPLTGTLSGLTPNDTIDFADLAWTPGKMSASFSGNTSGGILTVSNGSQRVNVNLAGNYTQSSWQLSRDKTGGTSVVDPPGDSLPGDAADGYKQPQSSRLSPDPELGFTNTFSITDTWLSHSDDGMIWRRIGSLPGSGSNSSAPVRENISNLLNDWLNVGAGILTTNAGGLTDASTTLVPPVPPSGSADDLLRHITATWNRG